MVSASEIEVGWLWWILSFLVTAPNCSAMKIDFSKIAIGNTVDSLIEPRAIFAALPAKAK